MVKMVEATIEPRPQPKPIDRAASRAATAGGTRARAYRQIRKAIADRIFEPGQYLQEATLADWLGVSRTPVREALRDLERDGLVAPGGGRGIVVTQVTIEDIEHAYLLLEVLEGLAGRLAAQRIGDEQAAALRPLLHAMREAAAAGEHERWAKLDAEFHDTIRSIAACDKLSELTGLVYPQIDRVRNTFLTEGADRELRDRILASHVTLGEAIIARDAEAAESIARSLFAEGRPATVALLRRWVSPLRRSF
jgi:DNA-binding GntR family transcriptional regulator